MRDKDGMKTIGRRDFLQRLTGTAALAGVMGPFEYARAAITPGEKGIYITNIYRTKLTGMGGIIIRLETNVGITGYGECRDIDSGAQAALNTFAPYIVGMNPTQVEDVYNTMMQHYTPPANMANQETSGVGAISGIEMACWDITGKVYNVPVYKLLGPRYNDKIRLYADTYGNTVADIESRVEKGFTVFKCFTYMVTNNRIAQGNQTVSTTPNNYGYKEITFNQTGLDLMAAYMEQHRTSLKSFGEPYASAPIGSDHYQGYNATDQLSVESAIALCEAVKPHIGAGWMEDIIDWWVDGCSGAPSKAVADATDVTILTGEDMFGFDQFKKFSDLGAFNLMHPEPNTAGGINQTLLAANYAHTKGIRTVFHNSSGPIAMTAYAHIAAAIPDFYALEYNKFVNNNRTFNSWHDDLIDGIDKPMIQNGYMNVPEGPGLGVTPNETQFAAHGAGTWTKVI